MLASSVDLSPFTLDFEGGGRLGAGAAATVYRVRDPQGREVALKVMDPELASDPAVAEAFLEQARAMSRFKAAGLVEIYDTGRLDDGRPFVSMEIVDGRSLAEVVARERVLSPDRTTRLGLRMAEALSVLHAKGALHGDLHPGNVLLLAGDRVCLLDAGGRYAETSAPGGVLFGSAEYLAPELLAGHGRTPATDVYAMGVMFYEALVGKTPFGSHSVSDVIQQQIHVEPRSVRAPAGLAPVPAPLEAVVLRCLRKDPAQRYADAAQLREALAALRADLTPPVIAPLRPAARMGPRWRTMAVAGIGVVLLAATAGLLAAGADGESDSVATVAASTPADTRTVAIDVTSEPEGAAVIADGGEVLGTTPAHIEVPFSTTSVPLRLRFPAGETTTVEVLPDRSARVHAQSPELHRYVSGAPDSSDAKPTATTSTRGERP